jgi:alkylation response protein AidB-like acyl-CoA dehydrogenase
MGEQNVVNPVLVQVPAGFEASEEQQELRAMVRRFLAAKSPEDQVREDIASETGYNADLWRQMAQLGVAGLPIPERFGGSGGSSQDLFVVLEEMGRTLFCSPFFSSVVLAVGTLLRAGDEELCRQVLPGIAEGELTATLALTEADGDWRVPTFGTQASPAGDGWVISGVKSYVIDGMTADGILVAAQTPGDGVGLFWVEDASTVAGLHRTPLTTLDGTRRIADLSFHATPARLVRCSTSAAEVLAWMREFAGIAQAAEQVGAASACLDSAVSYAKMRYQFGRPIGAFQAIKHKCADMLIAVESARALAQCAYSVADQEATEPESQIALAAGLAGAACGEALNKVAADHIQILGGIGFTWEHPAHLYYRRAKAAEYLFGTPHHHRERAAQRLRLTPELAGLLAG